MRLPPSFGRQGTCGPSDDAELRGIAIAPGGDAVWERPWLRDAMQGLRGQGMMLLSLAEARAYLDSDEAAYWVWRWGGTPCWRQVRWPALWKRLLWRVWPPALPRDRELAAHREAASSGQIGSSTM